MKIVSLVASPRGMRGNTAALLRLVLEGAEAAGATAETIVLPGNTVLPCKACDSCHKKGACPQKDDFEAIKAKIYESDGLVLASPNYIFSVSAQMKAFMDRCCGVIHCMSFEGKYGVSVVTSGGGDEQPIADYMNHFLITTGITPVGSVCATMGGVSEPAFADETKREAIELGRNLVNAWKTRAAFPEVDRAKGEFKNRMQLLMTYRKEQWPYEWEYWRKNRGLT
ncbi:MAG: flavodoxin family protein [Candidatus Abyssobacteria bacterium SURF_17]|jgi:multimeric flavodoxin WrbA|uniref:Flavodoxin family protein n=1 Tax=Candidatus Abyssobacteria bacterium SURF_17 TaxID=2093361 RepID=A0A419F5Z4_9BACT|nr:MAG: flavodoxin family protein [Candidatus Abyssubacteria bacterium SURF_17]